MEIGIDNIVFDTKSRSTFTRRHEDFDWLHLESPILQALSSLIVRSQLMIMTANFRTVIEAGSHFLYRLLKTREKGIVYHGLRTVIC